MRCEIDGCYGAAQEYSDPDNIWVYCAKHAAHYGWCPTCGYCVGGFEVHDESLRQYGICYDCVLEFNSELGNAHEYGYPDEYDHDYGDDPIEY